MSVPEREEVSGRLPPQDLDAELGAGGDAALRGRASPRPSARADDFYRERTTARSSQRCRPLPGSIPSTRSPCAIRLDQRGSLEQVGGRPAVFALAERRFPSSRTRGATPRSCARCRCCGADPRRHRGRATRSRPPGRHARADRHGRAEGPTRSRRTARARTSRSSSSRSTAFHRLTLLFEHGDGSGVTGSRPASASSTGRPPACRSPTS